MVPIPCIIKAPIYFGDCFRISVTLSRILLTSRYLANTVGFTKVYERDRNGPKVKEALLVKVLVLYVWMHLVWGAVCSKITIYISAMIVMYQPVKSTPLFINPHHNM